MFSGEREKERVQQAIKNREKKSWEIYKSSSMVEALHKARDLGWKDKKVQVRLEKTEMGEVYFVEPFEKGCGCRGILKYKDYFD
jgi:hypothetical protein